MTAPVAHVGEIDRWQYRGAAERRFSLARMAADYDRLYRAILETSWPGDVRPDGDRHTVSTPWSVGEAPASPCLPGTVTLVEGSELLHQPIQRRHPARAVRPGHPRPVRLVPHCRWPTRRAAGRAAGRPVHRGVPRPPAAAPPPTPPCCSSGAATSATACARTSPSITPRECRRLWRSRSPPVGLRRLLRWPRRHR